MIYPFNVVPSFLYIIFGFILIKLWMDNRAKQTQERLRVLEDALKRGNLDDITKAELMEALTGRRVKSRPVPPAPHSAAIPGEAGLIMKLVTFVGWMGFCLGMSFVIVVANFRGFSELELPAIILSCVGFGMVTFPFVIRELQGTPKRHASEPGS